MQNQYPDFAADFYIGKDKIYGPADHPVITQKENSIRFNNVGQFITEYVNYAAGVRQNFIIQQKQNVILYHELC